MRVAPIGLFAPVIGDNERVFTTAVEAAALTHGHLTGSLAAGYFASTIAGLLSGASLPRALAAADIELGRQQNTAELKKAIDTARTLAAAGRPSPERLETLGGGWVAEEALAIAVYAALVSTDFADGVLLAVNHSGDSDSTGAMSGNLLGAQYGVAGIPPSWLGELELRDEIERMAANLDAICAARMTPEQAKKDYPGW